jgi:hypothetical protein
VKPIFYPLLMRAALVAAFASAGLALYTGWPLGWAVYSMPMVVSAIIAIIAVRKRKNIQEDNIDFRKSQKAVDWIVKEFEEEKQKEAHGMHSGPTDKE